MVAPVRRWSVRLALMIALVAGAGMPAVTAHAAAPAQTTTTPEGKTWCLQYPVVHYQWMPGGPGYYWTEWRTLFCI